MYYLRHIPHMILMSPKDENELKQMLFSATIYERPVAVRYPRGEAIGVPVESGFTEIPLGKWEVLRTGADVTLIGCGPVVYSCLHAAEELEKEEGISAAVINGRFIKPMDREMLVDFAARTGRIVTLEENSAIGGFGSGVMEILSEEGVVVPVKVIGLPDRFLPHASQKLLRQQIGLDKDSIKKTVKHWLNSE
jgi:1-deoxy-D-xylulose-5-phosphate synthase